MIKDVQEEVVLGLFDQIEEFAKTNISESGPYFVKHVADLHLGSCEAEYSIYVAGGVDIEGKSAYGQMRDRKVGEVFKPGVYIGYDGGWFFPNNIIARENFMTTKVFWDLANFQSLFRSFISQSKTFLAKNAVT